MVDTSSAVTLPPVPYFVTSRACYFMTLPYQEGYYQATLTFTHDIGNPAIRSVIAQDGQSLVPCARNLTFYVYVSTWEYPTSGGCGSGESYGAGPQAGLAQAWMLEAGAGGVVAQAHGPPWPCQWFKRGDANADGAYNVADASFHLNHLFLGGPSPTCDDASDSNNDGKKDIADASYTLAYLFLGTVPPPPAPFPDCGYDEAGDPGDELGCAAYAPCPQCGCDLPPFRELVKRPGPGDPPSLPPYFDTEEGAGSSSSSSSRSRTCHGAPTTSTSGTTTGTATSTW